MKRTYQPSKIVRKRRHGFPLAYGDSRWPQDSVTPSRTGSQESCQLNRCVALAPKLQVLRKRAEFLAVAASGKKWVAPSFILQIGAPHPPTTPIRYGLTASRKVGNAVTRNRARRRLRALAAEMLPYASPEHDYVLVARDTAPDYVYDAMRQDMVKGMKRMKIWQESAV